MYGERPDEQHPLPATDLSEVEPQFLRRIVSYPTREQPGTIVVDTDNRYLYLVMEGGKAVRYGIGVGKQGMSWRGRATVARKAQWPRWTPTAAMIAREPERNRPWAAGMAGGLENPLGARALYLYQGNRDTLYRIHGTSEPWSIGKSVSSGCIRLFNQDIIDLYSRVPSGTTVVVLNRGSLQAPPMSTRCRRRTTISAASEADWTSSPHRIRERRNAFPGPMRVRHGDALIPSQADPTS